MIDQVAISTGAASLMRENNWNAVSLSRRLGLHPSTLSAKLRGTRRWTSKDVLKLEALGLNAWERPTSPNEMVNHDYEFQVACSILYLTNHLAALVTANSMFSEHQKLAIRRLAVSLEPLPEAFK